MNRSTGRLLLLLAVGTLSSVRVAWATGAPGSILTGNFVNWRESTTKTVGDGVNAVTMYWSINTLHKGWFYGSTDSDVAFAPGVSAIEQITNAGALPFIMGSIGPHSDAAAAANHVGDFIVWRNRTSGHFGVLRINDINPNLNTGPNFGHDDDFLQGTWWFQSNGTGNFSNVPEPVGGPLIAAAACGLAGARRRGMRQRARVPQN
jgi:hypothetical protein